MIKLILLCRKNDSQRRWSYHYNTYSFYYIFKSFMPPVRQSWKAWLMWLPYVRLYTYGIYTHQVNNIDKIVNYELVIRKDLGTTYDLKVYILRF